MSIDVFPFLHSIVTLGFLFLVAYKSGFVSIPLRKQLITIMHERSDFPHRRNRTAGAGTNMNCVSPFGASTWFSTEPLPSISSMRVSAGLTNRKGLSEAAVLRFPASWNIIKLYTI
jgi:hypothetical protein